MTTTLTEAPTTGLRYDTGKLQWHLMDYRAMEPMIQVLMYGAKKYTVELEDGTVVPGDHNWKKGMALEKILDCMQRHVADLMAGETIDKESGLPIIGHVLCNGMFASHFMLKEQAAKSPKPDPHQTEFEIKYQGETYRHTVGEFYEFLKEKKLKK